MAKCNQLTPLPLKG